MKRRTRPGAAVLAMALASWPGGVGAAAPDPDRAGTTVRASVDSAGAQAKALAPASFWNPAASADGRYVAFTSSAANLGTVDTNGQDDVFVTDRQSGTTTLVSVTSDGRQGDDASSEPAISADGRYVAFSSEATNLAASDQNQSSDIFVHDRQSGTTVRVSLATGGGEANRRSSEPTISANGTVVAFSSDATNLVTGDSNEFVDVFSHDMASATTTMVSNVASGPPGGNEGSFSPELSADGKVLAFSSVASNLVATDTNNSTDVFVTTPGGGPVERVSVNSAGQEANDGAAFPAVSNDGSVVVFFSGATNLGPGDTNNAPDLFIRQRGPSPSTERLSVTADGAQANAASYGAAVSADGMAVAFTSDADNLVTGDANEVGDVFLRTRGPGATTVRVSVDAADHQLEANSDEPAITADGQRILFTNSRYPLGAEPNGSANGGSALLERNLAAGTTTVIATPPGGVRAGGSPASNTPSLSADGRYLVFASSAVDLVANDTNEAADVFMRDLVTGRTTRANVGANGEAATADSDSPGQSGDGRLIVFVTDADNLVPDDRNEASDVFVRDRDGHTTTRVSVGADGTESDGASYTSVISADGRFVAFTSDATNLVEGDENEVGDVFVHDLATAATTRVSVASDGTEADLASDGPSLSGDGALVAFNTEATTLVAGDTNSRNDVFVHDRATAQTTKVSRAPDGGQADQDSDPPVLSTDGRYLAFSAVATNLVAGDTNRQPDVFVAEVATGAIERVSVGETGGQGDDSSYEPQLSADGSLVAFTSHAANLVAGDTNGKDDIFVRDRRASTTTKITGSGGSQSDDYSSSPVLSADGRWVGFASYATNLVAGDTNSAQDVFVHDRRPAPGSDRSSRLGLIAGLAAGAVLIASLALFGRSKRRSSHAE